MKYHQVGDQQKSIRHVVVEATNSSAITKKIVNLSWVDINESIKIAIHIIKTFTLYKDFPLKG